MIFMANLKCNHTRKSFEEYAQILDESLKDENVFVFPPSSAFLEGSFKFKQAAQNFYPAKNGSFTGEIGQDMLDEFDIKTVLIGHSERRAIGESEEQLKAKFEYAKKEGFKIVYCIGENEEIFEKGKTKEFLKSQLENIDLDYENLIIAYEPIWAIGTGKTASSEIINDVLNYIRNFSKSSLLYGGSVNEKNIATISKIKNCSGVLVGTASWDAKAFLKLINSAKEMI
ncbi:triosephosphate isomerase [Campylobacter blaseri]|uniref:Triosephosphate isomerase n=1 Tax=Campylobacter blaseri TaxID=2042961 RepID=A0A2P8R1E5_9BACT|nr:triose-phosphate isomerase [Campylobacter blaseri]PSM52327.1 triose-phosphate isomerase [Campylobacter blaseri]PSM54093.1 triose-phosphate isomerase [Campylobacter blaseri]QKF85535.1 triosephosphate isomerase [Campylobacter blaseri]